MLSFNWKVVIIPQNVYILRHITVLAEVDESHYIHLLRIAPDRKYKLLKPIYTQFTYQKLVAKKNTTEK